MDTDKFDLEMILEHVAPESREQVIALAALNSKTSLPGHIDTAVAWLRANGYYEKSARVNDLNERHDECLNDKLSAGHLEAAYQYALDNSLSERLPKVEAAMLGATDDSKLFLKVIKNHIKSRQFKAARETLELGINHFENPAGDRTHPDYTSLVELIWKATDIFPDETLTALAESWFTKGEKYFRRSRDWENLIKLYNLKSKLDSKEDDTLLGKRADAYAKQGDVNRAVRFYLEQHNPRKAIRLIEQEEGFDWAIDIAKEYSLPKEVKRLQQLKEQSYITGGHIYAAAQEAEKRGELEHAIELAKQGLPATDELLVTLLAKAGKVEEMCAVVESRGLYHLFKQGSGHSEVWKALDGADYVGKRCSYQDLGELYYGLG